MSNTQVHDTIPGRDLGRAPKETFPDPVNPQADGTMQSADGRIFANDRVVDKSPFAEPTKASDTMTGATSADVHTGLGHPGGGMTSTEIHHDGQHHRKREGAGFDQYGQPTENADSWTRET